MKGMTIRRASVLRLAAGVSAIATIGHSRAFAQETQQTEPAQPSTFLATEDEAVGDIVVTAIRASLANTQEIKRWSDTIVDAIIAEDIGALPDRSINEAIDRFAAPNDPQHFSVEGSGVQIRGLTYTCGELNGRNTFAVSAGRDIGCDHIPDELAGSVGVFKNATADLIEGGIAGTVSISTRRPFDSNDRIIYLSGAMSWGDLGQRDEGSFAGQFSNQWTVGGSHRIGLLVGGSPFQQRSRISGPNSWFYNNAFNNRSINDVDGYAFRGDLEYDVSDDSFLRTVRVGGRYTKRQQTVRTNDYNNWDSLSATWVGQGPRFVSVTQDAITTKNFEGFFRGDASVPSVPAIREDILSNHDALTELLRRALAASPGSLSGGTRPGVRPHRPFLRPLSRTGERRRLQGVHRPHRHSARMRAAGLLRPRLSALTPARRIAGRSDW